MKYACLFKLIPQEYETEFTSKAKCTMQDAANALQWHIYNGLKTNLNRKIDIFTVVPISSWPQYYRDPFISEHTYSVNDDELKMIGFCNIKLIRKRSIPIRVYQDLKKWCQQDDDEKILFVYSFQSELMLAVQRLKNEVKNLKVVVIVADLPDMIDLSSKQTAIRHIFENKFANDSYSTVNSVDAFVFLTKYMAEYMKTEKPFCVMEGIATMPLHFDEEEKNSESEYKTIMYTGTLHKKYGIMNLVQAFQEIPNPEYRLVICGIGDSEEEIKFAAQQDSRIQFKGQLKRADVLAMQRSATVLVNPRQNNEEFTKYSFPSKTLEYLSSGIPLVAYKLDGIPDEYDNHIYYVQDDSVESLREKLLEICEMDSIQREKRALSTQQFVLGEKNQSKQTMKVLDFLRERGILND